VDLVLISATVRVRPVSKEEEKPDRKRLERAASLLEQHGFDVLRIGRFGVSVRGDHTVFSRVLGVDVQIKKSSAAPVGASDPRLHDLVDRVEVASDPNVY
jgi:hypothetical protein